MSVCLTCFFSDFSRISESLIDLDSWTCGSSATVKLVYSDGFFNLESLSDFCEFLADENDEDFDGDVEEVDEDYDFAPLFLL